LQFARAFGAEVTAFSTSAAKEEEALALGAHHFVNTRDSKGLKNLAGKFDFIISTINAEQDWSAYMNALRPTGTLVFVGVPPVPLALPVFPLVAGQRNIAGSPIGSPWQIREMLDVAARHGVQAQTESFAFDKVNVALSKVRKNQVRYRAVLAR
jgi:alcohol/geraniol dehydrogenase (NADP+)